MKKLGNLYIHGDRKRSQIALTFDDAPSCETEKILDFLKKYDAKATFFVCGYKIAGAEKVLKRMIREGHEVGNHSYNHGWLAFKSQDYIKREIVRCDKELSKLNITTNLFRPPHLSMFYNLFKICKKLKKKIILCDIISQDWKIKGVNYALENIKGTRNGSILNFHDYIEEFGRNEKIIPLLKKVIPSLKKKGYKFVTVSQLLFNKNN